MGFEETASKMEKGAAEADRLGLDDGDMLRDGAKLLRTVKRDFKNAFGKDL